MRRAIQKAFGEKIKKEIKCIGESLITGRIDLKKKVETLRKEFD